MDVSVKNKQEEEYYRLKGIIKNILNDVKETYTVWFQSRLKSEESIREKVQVRKKELDDVIGFRLIYPWTDGLYELSDILQKHTDLNIFEVKSFEKGKVIYLYGKTNQDDTYEIQLWPTIIYTCFEYEHDKIYKPKIPPTKLQLENSNKVREKEHILQNQIDENRLVPYDS
ncbi:nucleotidyltransferase relA/spot protein [Fadolivirus algeromassiliense]|jgi:hypothetical protein|uniref:Nucleotidyltransferase relA/spot protein n=1 Tax=Fadolivirus FV1/VV64 TaxID=3070911 RepID=A0A7D3R1N1_9VIRU|nr:nucleotidyltransferase relA/spot protein [Fadolivirus algeromassiliense]QKF94622.1 nucleotidyltransferase relA/spot protein [Fadolivirus FV1/VV64]